MSHFLTLETNDKAMKFRFFFVIRVYCEKLGHMLKPLVPKFRRHLFARLTDVAEELVPAKLKPIAEIY